MTWRWAARSIASRSTRCSRRTTTWACAPCPLIRPVQEPRMQVVTVQEFYGVPIVESLARIKFLSPRTSLIHAVWLNPREIRALAESGATVQHNPWSNLTLGSGVQPTRALLDAGVNVSLGSDGACSTVSLNMLQVAGAAAALSKVRDADYATWISARDVLAEIHAEIESLAEPFAASEASVAPVRAAMDALYRRALQATIPADTYPSRL